MVQKFDYYDAVAHLIPGAIGCLVLLYFSDILDIVLPKPSVGSLSGLGVGIAVAYTLGHLLQSIASDLEPAYYLIWGGKPSVKLLERKSSLFCDAERQQLVKEFIDFFGVTELSPRDSKTKKGFYQHLFDRCMALCNRNKLGRVEAFVTSYGFHRVLLTTFLLSFVSCVAIWILYKCHEIALVAENLHLLKFMASATGVSTLIEIFRARKRAYHYAREVIMMTSDYIRSNKSGPPAI